MVAAAVIAGAAVAGVAGSVISSSASKSAASTQANAATQAANTQSQAALQAAQLQSDTAKAAAEQQRAQFDTTNANLAPYRNAGQGALSDLIASLGLGGPGQNINPGGLQYQTPGAYSSILSNPQFNPTQAQLEATPGYQFNLTQGLQSVQNSNAAAGRGISGAALKGAASFATGLANNTLQTQANIFQNNYQNALAANQQGAGIFQTNLGNVLNPLSNLVGTGENASALTGQQGLQSVANANALQVGGANAGAAGLTGAANAGAAGLIGAANAGAAGTVGSANAAANALGSVGSLPLNYALYNQLLSGNGSSVTGLGGSSSLTNNSDGQQYY